MTPRIWMAIVPLAAVLSLGCQDDHPTPSAQLAATNTLLECAARDLLGGSTSVLRLAEPGSCPGHFDIRPSQVAQLRQCRLLLRLDFQKSLDRKLARACQQGLRIAEIRVPGGLAEPDSYLAACDQAADAMVSAGLLSAGQAEERLERIRQRIADAAARSRARVVPLKDTPVLASGHQAAFCRWLGLRVVETFAGADTAAAGRLNRAVVAGEQAGVTLVIANRPEGRRVADALAERLGAATVVFGNFPAPDQGQSAFDDLLAANLRALLEAAGR